MGLESVAVVCMNFEGMDLRDCCEDGSEIFKVASQFSYKTCVKILVG